MVLIDRMLSENASRPHRDKTIDDLRNVYRDGVQSTETYRLEWSDLDAGRPCNGPRLFIDSRFRPPSVSNVHGCQ